MQENLTEMVEDMDRKGYRIPVCKKCEEDFLDNVISYVKIFVDNEWVEYHKLPKNYFKCYCPENKTVTSSLETGR